MFFKTGENLWLLQFYTPEQGSFELKSIDFAAPIAALYEDVTLEPTTADPSPESEN